MGAAVRLEAIATVIIVGVMILGTLFIAGSVPVLGLGWASFYVTVLCSVGVWCIGRIWNQEQS